MPEIEEILQQKLEELDRGAALEQVFAKLPDEKAAITPLLQLAASLRSIQHPTMNVEIAEAQQTRIVAAARAALAPERLAKNERISQRRIMAAAGWLPGRTIAGWLSSRRTVLALGTILSLAIIVAVAVLGLGYYNSGPASAHYTTLMDVTGKVEVASSSQATDWKALANGDRLQQGQRIRTGNDGGATLVFYDGSRTIIGPDAELSLAVVSGGWGDGLKVKFDQTVGLTNHSVVPLRGQASYFEVDTPAGQATVHGTTFSVAVTGSKKAIFAVERGKVWVNNALSKVTLSAGQATVAQADRPPEAPAYQFALRGVLDQINGNQWTINGVTFTGSNSGQVNGSFQEGDAVTVNGRILGTGEWLADEARPSNNGNARAMFTGLVTSIGTNSWVVGGKTVLVSNASELGGNIQIGDPVNVNFTVLPDGSWLARGIESLNEQSVETKPPAPNSPEITGTPSPVPEETSTPESSATPESSDTAPAPVMPQAPTAATSCTGNTDHQPEGLRMAQKHGVSYGEIMGWFCQGYGFGEIDQAYDLAKLNGKPPADLFALKTQGMGWGQIKKTYEPKPTVQTGGNDNNNGNKSDKEPKPTKVKKKDK
jgi:hypothetical protein